MDAILDLKIFQEINRPHTCFCIDFAAEYENTLNIVFESIARQLEECGFALLDQAFEKSALDALRSEAMVEYEEGLFKRAAIGKGLEKKAIAEIRGDRVKWLDRAAASENQQVYWQTMDELRNFLTSYFRVHLERTEAHFAVYPEGAFYAKHLDQFQTASNRIFSVILYLNPDWVEGHGGELRVHHADGTISDFAPLYGRLILFRSDAIEHEVMVTTKPRVSLTGWMRRDPLLV